MKQVESKTPAQQLGTLGLLILQPTSFCNISCSYCYLPDRDKVQKLSPLSLRVMLENIKGSRILGDSLMLQWHSGEPLVIPKSQYEQYFKQVRGVFAGGPRISHSIQTNAMLINDEWCDFFKKENVHIGVSIDGPKFINDKYRVTRKGKGTFDETMRGINCLKKHGIPFNVVAVLTYDALAYPKEIHDFFLGLGAQRVAFNVEESDGAHQSALLQQENMKERYASFMRKTFELNKHSQLIIREFDRCMKGIMNHRSQRELDFDINTPFSIISVDTKGNLSTFSPELLGVEDPKYDSFIFGNLLQDKLDTIIQQARYQKVQQEIAEGIEKCKEECDYFFLCGGGAPANKYGEHGRFDVSATKHCELHQKELIEIILDNLENEHGIETPQ